MPMNVYKPGSAYEGSRGLGDTLTPFDLDTLPERRLTWAEEQLIARGEPLRIKITDGVYTVPCARPDWLQPVALVAGAVALFYLLK